MGGSTISCRIRPPLRLLLLVSLGWVLEAQATPEILRSTPIPAPKEAYRSAPRYTTTMTDAKGLKRVVGKGFNPSQLAGTAPVGAGPSLADTAPPARRYTVTSGTPLRPVPANINLLAGHLLPPITAKARSSREKLYTFKTNAALTVQQQTMERKLTAKFLPYQQLTPQDILKPTFQKPKSP